MELHMQANEIQPALSPIFYDGDGSVAAAATLAVRGERGWIGGFGVAPAHRGAGVASLLLKALLTNARQNYIRTVALEVLSQNSRAIRTYERGGFRTRRKLESSRWLAPADCPAQVPLAAPDPFLDRPDIATPCWQRESRSLRRQPSLRAVSAAENVYAIFRHDRHEAQILKAEAQSSEELAALAASIAGALKLDGVSLFNEPSDSDLAGFARALGWRSMFEQHEMVRTL